MKTMYAYAKSRLYPFYIGLAISFILNSYNLSSQGQTVNDWQETKNATRFTTKTQYDADSLIQKEKRIIVEFHGESMARLYQTSYAKRVRLHQSQFLKAEQDRLFEQFGKDLEQIQAKGFYYNGTKKNFRIGAVHGRKYRLTFFGQQLTADSMMISHIEALPYVKAVHPDRVFRVNLNESVPQIHADSVWNELGCEGDSIRVGILDSGIDYLHPDLGGGYGPGYKVIGGYDFVHNDADPMDDHFHGTHVAGIVAANGSVRGVAPKALLYALKVMSKEGSGWESDIIAGIEWCVDPNGDTDISDHLDIANMSLGGAPREDDPVVEAVEAAISMGVTFCIAAGNSGDRGEQTIGSPGTSPSAITVGAVDKENVMAFFSSQGPAQYTYLPKPDVVAPGVEINSTVPGAGYHAYSGTSGSSPHVAGACALIKKLHPEWGPAEIKSALMLTARDINSSILAQGSGIINVYKASVNKIKVDKPVLFYGIDSLSTEEDWMASDTILITNLSSESKVYTMETLTPVAGINLSFPGSFSLDPGDSIRVPIGIEVENASLGEVPRNEKYFYADKIKISNDIDTIELSWSFIKAYRVYFNFGSDLIALTIFNKEKLIYHDFRRLITFPITDILLNSDTYYVIAEMQDTLTSGSGLQYTLMKEVDLKRDTTLVFDSRDATNMIVFDTEDNDGMKFTDGLAKYRKMAFELPGVFLYTKTVFSRMDEKYDNISDFEYGELTDVVSIGIVNELHLTDENTFRVMDTLFCSDIPEGIKLYLAETRRKIQADNMLEFCFNETGPLPGLSDMITLKGEANEYGTLYYRNNVPDRKIKWTTELFNKKERLEVSIPDAGDGDKLERYYSVSMASKPDLKRETFFYFMMQREPELMCAPVQYLDDQFVIGNGKTAGALYYENGDTVYLTAPPWYAGILDGSDTYSKMLPDSAYFFFFPAVHDGTRTFIPFDFSSVGYLMNEQGDTLYQGDYVYYKNFPGKYKIEFNIGNAEKLYGLPVKNKVEAWFESLREDHSPPYLRYMYMQNSEGRYTPCVPKGDSVNIILTLSSEEVTRSSISTGKPVPYDSAKVYTKLHEEEEWIQLETDSLGYDFREGLVCSSRFSLSQYDSALFDLKIVFSDFAGNRTQNTITPALYVRNIQIPIANDDNYSCTPGVRYTSDHSILDNDVDPWGWEDYLTIELLTDVSHGDLTMLTSGKFNYEPEEDFTGTDQFSYRLSNELYYSAPAVVTVNVIPDNTDIIRETESDEAWAYPNPASKVVNIGLNLATDSEISVDIYSITGSHIANVHSGMLPAGTHILQWNNVNEQAETIQAGIYLVRIRSTGINQTLKLIIE